MNAEFWRNRSVFLTGHTGFKGGWLSLWLKSLGARVSGYALAPESGPSLHETVRIGDEIDEVIGDVRDFDAIRRRVADVKPEIVFHMAAQPLVRRGYSDPVGTYSTNVMGTVHVLEAARQSGGVRAVVNVTSDKCYENKEWPWGYRENEPMGGHDPYSSSKGCSELVTSAFRHSYFSSYEHGRGLALASARAGNVIGGGDWAEDRLVPDVIRAVLLGRPVLVRNPHAVRPWQHVLEPLSGYLLLAERLYDAGEKHASAWNFGPSPADARPVSWIVERLVNEWGDGASWERDQVSHPHEATYLSVDSAKARTELGWRPKLNLDQTVRAVVSWHKAHARGVDMKRHMLAEIESYMSAACGP